MNIAEKLRRQADADEIERLEKRLAAERERGLCMAKYARDRGALQGSRQKQRDEIERLRATEDLAMKRYLSEARIRILRDIDILKKGDEYEGVIYPGDRCLVIVPITDKNGDVIISYFAFLHRSLGHYEVIIG